MSKKKNNGKSGALISDFLTILFCGIILGFLALPQTTTFLLGEPILSISGYDFLSSLKSDESGISILVLLMIIFAGLTIFATLLKFLVDAGAVKSSGFVKFTKFLLVFSSFVLLVASVVNIVLTSSQYGALNELQTGTSAILWTMIVNIAVSFLAMATAIFSCKKN